MNFFHQREQAQEESYFNAQEVIFKIKVKSVMLFCLHISDRLGFSSQETEDFYHLVINQLFETKHMEPQIIIGLVSELISNYNHKIDREELCKMYNLALQNAEHIINGV